MAAIYIHVASFLKITKLYIVAVVGVLIITNDTDDKIKHPLGYLNRFSASYHVYLCYHRGA